MYTRTVTSSNPTDVSPSVPTRITDVNTSMLTSPQIDFDGPDGSVIYHPGGEPIDFATIEVTFGKRTKVYFPATRTNDHCRVTVQASEFLQIIRDMVANFSPNDTEERQLLELYAYQAADKLPSLLEFEVHVKYDRQDPVDVPRNDADAKQFDKLARRFAELNALRRPDGSGLANLILSMNGYKKVWIEPRVSGHLRGKCFDALVRCAMGSTLGAGDGIDDILECWDNDDRLFVHIASGGFRGRALGRLGMSVFAAYVGFNEFEDAAGWWRLNDFFMRKEREKQERLEQEKIEAESERRGKVVEPYIRELVLLAKKNLENLKAGMPVRESLKIYAHLPAEVLVCIDFTEERISKMEKAFGDPEVRAVAIEECERDIAIFNLEELEK